MANCGMLPHLESFRVQQFSTSLCNAVRPRKNVFLLLSHIERRFFVADCPSTPLTRLGFQLYHSIRVVLWLSGTCIATLMQTILVYDDDDDDDDDDDNDDYAILT